MTDKAYWSVSDCCWEHADGLLPPELIEILDREPAPEPAMVATQPAAAASPADTDATG